MLPPDVHTTATLSGHVWALVGPGRAVYAISVSEVARMAQRAVDDNRGMYEDPDEAMEAIRAHIQAALTDSITPED